MLPDSDADTRGDAPPRPGPETDRLLTLDVLRGVAVLGILIMNVQSFALVHAARRQPEISGGFDGLNRLLWTVGYLLADTKFITLFSMLFGAGVALMMARHQANGRPGIALHMRRMAVLAAIGLLHGTVVWDGDILFTYAVYGVVIMWFTGFSAPVLLSLGGACLAIDAYAYGWNPTTWGPSFESMDYLERIGRLVGGLVPYFFQGTGCMFVGMGLIKTGFLTGRGRPGAYAWTAAAGLGGGVLLIGVPTQWGPNYADWPVQQAVYWGSLVVSAGWAAAAIALALAAPRLTVTRALAAVGRMALTNYLVQNIVCAAIFYSYGFGLYEKTGRTTQFAILLAIWFAQLLYSPIWLRHFRFGPVEYLWRAATYRHWPPLRRTAGI